MKSVLFCSDAHLKPEELEAQEVNGSLTSPLKAFYYKHVGTTVTHGPDHFF